MKRPKHRLCHAGEPRRDCVAALVSTPVIARRLTGSGLPYAVKEADDLFFSMVSLIEKAERLRLEGGRNQLCHGGFRCMTCAVSPEAHGTPSLRRSSTWAAIFAASQCAQHSEGICQYRSLAGGRFGFSFSRKEHTDGEEEFRLACPSAFHRARCRRRARSYVGERGAPGVQDGQDADACARCALGRPRWCLWRGAAVVTAIVRIASPGMLLKKFPPMIGTAPPAANRCATRLEVPIWPADHTFAVEHDGEAGRVRIASAISGMRCVLSSRRRVVPQPITSAGRLSPLGPLGMHSNRCGRLGWSPLLRT
jgi:hypothetical protein